MRTRPDHDAAGNGPKQAPKRRASKAMVVAPAAPLSLPAIIERAAASITTIEGLREFLALKAQMEADAERRLFDQDFAWVQAEIGRVAANAYDPQKRNSYANLNAIDDAVRPLLAVKGFTLTYSSALSSDGQSLTVAATVSRNGAERRAEVAVRMDGVGLKGAPNMSPAQASGATFTYGRRMAQTALFNLTTGGGTAKPPAPAAAPSLFSDDQPPWDAPPGGDLLTVLRRAARRAQSPPTDDEIVKLAKFLRERGERAETVIEHGALERHAVRRFVIERREARS